ncbi:TrmH family RNA methyltransferase [Leptolyngbya sp. GGD]|uniref:TrmH family RNA methyltransferase n=1 Tax=Leptolyngbya sp. GGD TaxID=2997907 RepID=UPI00227A51C7|nr:RNA methyltransferase [Leptolyngbya sp. GGD]MCY6490172.1 RNA methyltransferase [Leptolyngbya sp. GGD]
MLTSLQNPLVKQLRKLHRAKERREQQLFLLEGTHLIEEACAVGVALNTVCYTEHWQQNHESLWQKIQARSSRIELVSPEVLKAIATTVEPDGIVATVDRFHTQPVQFTKLGLVLETIQDPGNLGTIIRTAAAAGVEGLWLSADCVDLESPKVLRSSSGQWFRLPMSTSDLRTDILKAKQQGMQVIATVPTATQTYWEIDFTQPSLVLMGNEGAGLSDELIELADIQVTIPLAPGVESLNVAIATALILYEARRQQEKI